MSTPDFFRARLGEMIDLRHPLAVLAGRLPWAAIEAAVAPKLVPAARPAQQLSGQDLLGPFAQEFGGSVSPAGRPRRTYSPGSPALIMSMVIGACQWCGRGWV